jgi:hypothetical protein
LRANPDEPGSDGELLPGSAGFDEALAQGNYEFARTRFVRTVTRDGVARIVERAAQQRVKLRHEIDNLRALVRNKHEAAVDYARSYGSVLPHRVGRTWIQPPGQMENVGQFYGADRMYKLAARAAKDYVEIRDLLVKRRDQLINMEQELRDQLDRREEALIAQLESPRSLQIALQRDPLLNSAYQKLKALQGELKTSKVEDGIGDL